MKKIVGLTLYFLSFSPLLSNCQEKDPPIAENGRLKILFRNLVNGQPVLLDSSINSNPFEESFKLAKLKYYISHLALHRADKIAIEKNNYYLVDQRVDSSLVISLTMPADSYQSISFLIGVDSAMNTSGAQTGALDPLNDMFWTWNSGYIMFKIEGTSPQSTVINNKIEYHIGGFSGENSVLKYVHLPVENNKGFTIKKGETTMLVINADLDKFWEGDIPLKIFDKPVCTSPGPLAKQIAGNFSRIFAVSNIIQND